MAKNGTKHASAPVGDRPKACYVLSLRVENVRCFGPTQTLDLSGGNGRPAQWTIILGENGAGKTTLLQLTAGVERTPTPTYQSAGWTGDEAYVRESSSGIPRGECG